MSPPRDDDPPSSDDGSEGYAADGDPDPSRDRDPGPPSDPDADPAANRDVDPPPSHDIDPSGSRDADSTSKDRREGTTDRATGDVGVETTADARGGSAGGPGEVSDAPRPGQFRRRERPDAPPAHRASDESEDHWVRTVVVDVASSALAVLLVGFFLFTVSGVWPPMVAVESASMTPNMETGDLVFVMDEQRFPGEAEHGDTGVVTARAGAASDYQMFSQPGDVVVYKPDGNGGETPIIHRAMFWVEEDERWYDRADKDAVAGADSCDEMANCPAPHAGFITKGDANGAYDQVGPSPHSGPVKPAWIVGTAEGRIPGLGCIRLRSQDCSIGLSTAPGLDAGFPILGVPVVGFHLHPGAAFDLMDGFDPVDGFDLVGGLERSVPDATFAGGLV